MKRFFPRVKVKATSQTDALGNGRPIDFNQSRGKSESREGSTVRCSPSTGIRPWGEGMGPTWGNLGEVGRFLVQGRCLAFGTWV